ncbi:cation:proton antiporter [Rhizosaccharibacter radicis]|uniref:Cation:proton antiporter n=1 Tax=Rhizosaccharibacter radicis TaxID=2782605 RepID=A0ABT1W062_9PROT|nr:cation:proton antiporter [Acetobacteraceae bacterium KSS12]
MPDHAYAAVLAGLGALALLVAWLPLVLERLPLSLPILSVGIGAALFSIPGMPPAPNPLGQSHFAEELAEFCVLVSLMGAGLKLDRPLSLHGWRPTWRLLLITMPLSIGLLTLLGSTLLGLGIGTALLVGAALAPTDPVLAGDVQVGPPGTEETDEVRFSLTSEAGLNDAAAFPFVLLALGVVGPDTTWISSWIGYDLVLRTVIGLTVGWVTGRLLGWVTFRLPEPAQLARTEQGFVSLAATLLIYGISEMADGYGFVSVFIAAITFRHVERRHDYHHKLYGFSEGIEHLLTMVLLLLLGGALARGLLHGLRWEDAAFGALAVLVVRPIAGMIGLAGLRHWRSGVPWPWDERLIISFFGIRGIGSIYYLTFALNRHEWPQSDRLQALIGFIVLFSITIHGITATPTMTWLDRRRGTRADARRRREQERAGPGLASGE